MFHQPVSSSPCSNTFKSPCSHNWHRISRGCWVLMKWNVIWYHIWCCFRMFQVYFDVRCEVPRCLALCLLDCFYQCRPDQEIAMMDSIWPRNSEDNLETVQLWSWKQHIRQSCQDLFGRCPSHQSHPVTRCCTHQKLSSQFPATVAGSSWTAADEPSPRRKPQRLRINETGWASVARYGK